MFAMNALTVISTDLLTPLGAYLRLRQGGRASFLLESVEQGRLGRHSFVGCGSRLVSFEEAEACGQPVVGYLGYEHAAQLEPTVPVPDEGRDLPESRFVVAEMLVRFDHALGMAEVLCGDPAAVAELLEGPQPSAEPASRPRSGSTRRLPSRHQYERAVVKAKEHIRAGDAFQVVLSQRAERPTSASALELYRSLRRVNPSPYLFLLELDGLALVGSSPETLVKAEGRHASLNPIAGTTRPGRRRRRAAALVREGPRRARDARRPRPQRPLARLPAGNGARGALPRAGALLARHAPRLGGRRRARAGGLALRPAARVLPGRHGLGRAEGAGDAADRRARGATAAGRTPARCSTRSPARRSTPASRSARSSCTTGVALLQAGAGIVADSDPAAEHDECLRKLAALEMAIELAEARSA